MTLLTVLYPKTETSGFDHDYYLSRHVPMVKSLLAEMGMIEVRLARGVSSLNGSLPHYELTGEIYFSNSAQLSAALAAHGAKIIEDIPNFTDVTPVIQVSESIDSFGG